MGGVIIGMDPHKASATIEVPGGRERVLGGGRYAMDRDGYRAMRDAVAMAGAGMGGRGKRRDRPASGSAADR